MVQKTGFLAMLLGIAIPFALATSWTEVSKDLKISDDGYLQITEEGVLNSMAADHTILGSKELSPDVFKSLTKCELGSAERTKACLDTHLGPETASLDFSPRGEEDNGLSERALSCAVFICSTNKRCRDVNQLGTERRCTVCLVTPWNRTGVCSP
ncbi:hypothetical protein FBEOM_13297 [Fusarium beomiforme]|uniref:Uncharacterized protein n=1 Tax=Fusarium beomiforme TaxID=44412 RepID=A0A9P5DSK1_9HYPO|nr:hypothetical protein FBEOM_13297 [Fusarium beomiforme]